METDLIEKYQALIAQEDFFHDDAQFNAVGMLEDLRIWVESSLIMRKGLFSGLLTRKKPEPPRGLYLWGGVGAGKSMLMDLFYETISMTRKRRVHFHAFMQEVHENMHKARQKGAKDPIVPIAAEIAAEARLLCFDEMQITDITDAMLVGRLFEQLFNAGTTIVATSNRVPDDLYKNGLNRQLFLPFIALIKEKMVVHHLYTETDYRQDRLRGQQTYFFPLGDASTAELDRIWAVLSEGKAKPHKLRVKGRDITLPGFHNGTARASFKDLCEAPLGPGDFLAIAEAVRVLILDNIPRMSRARNNEAKRFVTLIDALYEAKVQLICSAETEANNLYQEGAGAFEFERTASRLSEMQSADWGQA